MQNLNSPPNESNETSQAPLSWQERVKWTEQLHKAGLKSNPKHRVSDTAKELNKSLGRTSEDLTLAAWMKKDPKVAKFKFLEDALTYVRVKKRELKFK